MINTYDISFTLTVGFLSGCFISRIIDYEFNRIYNKKIESLEKRIEKLEDFRLSIYEKNLLIGEKREWDEISSELSDHSSEIDVDEDEIE